jgi:hypothetical protein
VGTPGAPHDGYVDALVQALTYLRGYIGASSAQSTAARLRTGDRIASTPGRRASITNSDSIDDAELQAPAKAKARTATLIQSRQLCDEQPVQFSTLAK